MNRSACGYLLVGGAAASWGLWPLVLREAARFGEIDASHWSAALMAVTTIATLPSLAGLLRAPMPRRALLFVALLGVTDAANAWLFFQAYRTTTVALAVSTHYLAPILVALFAPLVNGEERHPRALGAAIAAFAGLMLVLNPFATTLDRSDLVGSAFGTASAVTYAANVFLNRRIGEAFTGAQVMALHGLVATPLLVFLTPVSAWSATAAGTYGVLVAAGLTIGAASGVAFIRGLRVIPTARGAVLTFLEPIVALALGVLALDQPLAARAVAGAVAILLAGAFVVAPVGAEPPQSR